MAASTAWYDANAERISERYEAVSSERVHGWLTHLLPASPATVLDVGAGSGRDAAWLSALGYDVVAVEPSPRMLALARTRHAGRPVQWIADSLPALSRTFRSGLSFDVILLSAVWMHVAPSDRAKAFRKLMTILRPGGLLAVLLRHGPAEAGRGFHPVSADEIRMLARNHGAFVEREAGDDDALGRRGVHWTKMAVRLPDDGTGALPLLRHVTLNDDKSSTYKLGLLRALCRIADGAAGMSRAAGDDHVAVPMGLLALTWIRLYKPLLRADLPQNPRNRGCDRLGFAKQAFRRLDTVSHHDLRAGMQFSGAVAADLHRAVKDAARTITGMPARYMTYPDGVRPILPVRGPVTRVGAGRIADVRLDEEYLTSFGSLHVPAHPVGGRPAFHRLDRACADRGMDSTDEVVRRAAAPGARRRPDRSRHDVVGTDARREHRAGASRTAARVATSPLRVERQAPVGENPRHRPLLSLDDLAVRGSLEPDACPPDRQSARETRSVAGGSIVAIRPGSDSGLVERRVSR